MKNLGQVIVPFSPQKVPGQLTVCGIAKKHIFNNKIIKVKLPIDSRDEDLKGFKIFSSDVYFAVTCCYFFMILEVSDIRMYFSLKLRHLK